MLIGDVYRKPLSRRQISIRLPRELEARVQKEIERLVSETGEEGVVVNKSLFLARLIDLGLQQVEKGLTR